MSNAAVNPVTFAVAMFTDQPAELRAMSCLEQVMAKFDEDLTELDVKRIAAWFHDKYDIGL